MSWTTADDLEYANTKGLLLKCLLHGDPLRAFSRSAKAGPSKCVDSASVIAEKPLPAAASHWFRTTTMTEPHWRLRFTPLTFLDCCCDMTLFTASSHVIDKGRPKRYVYTPQIPTGNSRGGILDRRFATTAIYVCQTLVAWLPSFVADRWTLEQAACFTFLTWFRLSTYKSSTSRFMLEHC